MAIRAFVDPERAKRKQPIDPATGRPKVNVVGTGAGFNKTGTSAFRVTPKRTPQGVPASALPGTVNQPVQPPATDPNVYRPKPADIAALGDQMKAARESGDTATLRKLTFDQYDPAVDKQISSVANVNTAQVARIVGDEKPVPTDINMIRTELSSLGTALQKARDTGNWGEVGTLKERYKALVDAQNKVVTGQPVTNPPQAVGDQAAPAAVNLNAPATPLPDGVKPYQVVGEGSRSEGYYDVTGKFIYGKPPANMNQQGTLDPNAAMEQSAATKGTAAQTATGAPEAAGGGPPPDSTVPTGETDPTVPSGAPSNPYNPNNLFDARHFDAQGNPSPQIKESMDYYNQAIAQPPASVKTPEDAAAWQQMNQRLLEQFAAGIKQYPDQYGHEYENFRNRLTEAKNTWETTGRYTVQMDEILNKVPIEAKTRIDALDPAQKNELVMAAIEDMKNGIDPLTKMDEYLSKFSGVSTDFSLKPPGYTGQDYNLADYEQTPGIEIAGPDAPNAKIDAALANTSISAEGKAALKLQMETIQKRLAEGGGGFSDDELKKMAGPLLEQIEKEKQAAINSAKFEMAAQGKSSGGSYTSQIQAITSDYANKKNEAVMALVRENMGYKQTGTSESIAELGNIAESERGAGLEEKKLALTGATDQAKLALESKALYQNGQLTVWGKGIDQKLAAYNMALEQYEHDGEIDFKKMELDLQEREIEQGGTIESAKIKMDQIKSSIEAAGQEQDRYDRRTAAIADLQKELAQGDQEAEYKIEALTVQQELSVLGLNSDETKAWANIIYGVRTKQLDLDQDLKLKLAEIAASKEMKGSALANFAGQVLGAGAAILA